MGKTTKKSSGTFFCATALLIVRAGFFPFSSGRHGSLPLHVAQCFTGAGASWLLCHSNAIRISGTPCPHSIQGARCAAGVFSLRQGNYRKIGNDISVYPPSKLRRPRRGPNFRNPRSTDLGIGNLVWGYRLRRCRTLCLYS